MRVTFEKCKRNYAKWTAYRPKRRPLTSGSGGGMGQLPHDLAQFVVERELAHRHGFWGCVADGASFRTLVAAGQRRTPQGKAVIAQHVEEIDQAEAHAHEHGAAWRDGIETAVTPALDEMLARWLSLPEGGVLELDFPLATAGTQSSRRASSRSRLRR